MQEGIIERKDRREREKKKKQKRLTEKKLDEDCAE